MEIKIHSIHFDADQKLLDFIEKKVSKLGVFYDRPAAMEAEVYLKMEDMDAPVKDKVVEIKVHVPGTTLFASETTKSFEESLTGAVDHARRQIKKHKEKLHSK